MATRRVNTPSTAILSLSVLSAKSVVPTAVFRLHNTRVNAIFHRTAKSPQPNGNGQNHGGTESYLEDSCRTADCDQPAMNWSFLRMILSCQDSAGLPRGLKDSSQLANHFGYGIRMALFRGCSKVGPGHSKPETRRPKAERNPKTEVRIDSYPAEQPPIELGHSRNSDFGLLSGFGLRSSDFRAAEHDPPSTGRTL